VILLKISIFIIFLAICGNAFASGEFLFSSATEDTTKGWSNPSEKIARIVIADDINIKKNIDEQIAEDGLKKNYRQFLSIKSVNLSELSESYNFIRPKSDLYSSLYGAHIYHYWILNKYNKVVFSMTGDLFGILRGVTNGMHNIISRQCRGIYGCFDTTLAFIKNEYKPISCIKYQPEDNRKSLSCEDWDK